MAGQLRVKPDEAFKLRVEKVLGEGAFDLRGRRFGLTKQS